MPPQATFRNALLAAFFVVWSAIMLINSFRGQAPSMDDWAALGIGLGAIVALFRNSADQEGGGQ